MKKISFRTVVENKSRYEIDLVWENAKDLEHVGFLHRNTNAAFKLMAVEKQKYSTHEYDQMFYRTTRKMFFFRFQTTGYRKIIQKYNLQQIEYIPLFGITTCLNSLLFPSADKAFPTRMVDEVVMEIPWVLKPLVAYFRKALKRHTAIQCQEDEPFRARRKLLHERGIVFPFSIFNEPQFKTLAQQFEIKPYATTSSILETPSLIENRY